MKLNSDYIAGLFDGEGWFRISRATGLRSRTNRQYCFQAYAHLCMREKSMICALQNYYGGSVRPIKARKIQHSQAWQWTITCKNLDQFCYSMENKLKCKGAQLKVIRKFRNAAKKAANLKMTDKRYKVYENCHAELSLLNKKGVGKK